MDKISVWESMARSSVTATGSKASLRFEGDMPSVGTDSAELSTTQLVVGGLVVGLGAYGAFKAGQGVLAWRRERKAKLEKVSEAMRLAATVETTPAEQHPAILGLSARIAGRMEKLRAQQDLVDILEAAQAELQEMSKPASQAGPQAVPQ
jgi:hypothetical protein